MRVNENKSLSQPDRKKTTEYSPSKAGEPEFKEMLKDQSSSLTTEKWQQLLQNIKLAGERLAKSRTARDLVDYKNLIKSFIEEVTKNGMGMAEKQSSGQRGRAQTYKMISEIDKKLVELTNQTLDKESSQIDLLNKIGEIKGLLVNLYF